MRDPSHFLFFGSLLPAGEFSLPPDEAHHAGQVLRTAAGDMLLTTEGHGVIYTCKVRHIGSHGAQCEVMASRHVPAPRPSVRLAVGLPDRDCFERILTDATALGVAAIVPLRCEHGDHGGWIDKWDKLAARFSQKLRAAAKQARNPWLPLLDTPRPCAGLRDTAGGGVLLADFGGKPPTEVIPALRGAHEITCAVGPPGGFSDSESSELLRDGGTAVCLSRHRLRTELAAAILCGYILAPG
jgi:16S rRNA (uracil1498-N3)-methyltransferase